MNLLPHCRRRAPHTKSEYRLLRGKHIAQYHKLASLVWPRGAAAGLLGENIGSEIGGKSELFSRPVVILKKLAHGFYFVIPTTTQEKKGSWYVGFRQQGENMVACLHQARAIDYRRLSSKLGTLDDEDFLRVVEGFGRLYLKTFPAISGGAAGKSRM